MYGEESVFQDVCQSGHSSPSNEPESPESPKESKVPVNRDYVALVGDARRRFCVLYGGRHRDLEVIHSRYLSHHVQAGVLYFSVPSICLLNELGSLGYRVVNNVGKHQFGWILCRSHEIKADNSKPVPCECFSPEETPGPRDKLLATPRRKIKTITQIN